MEIALLIKHTLTDIVSAQSYLYWKLYWTLEMLWLTDNFLYSRTSDVYFLWLWFSNAKEKNSIFWIIIVMYNQGRKY